MPTAPIMILVSLFQSRFAAFDSDRIRMEDRSMRHTGQRLLAGVVLAALELTACDPSYVREVIEIPSFTWTGASWRPPAAGDWPPPTKLKTITLSAEDWRGIRDHADPVLCYRGQPAGGGFHMTVTPGDAQPPSFGTFGDAQIFFVRHQEINLDCGTGTMTVGDVGIRADVVFAVSTQAQGLIVEAVSLTSGRVLYFHVQDALVKDILLVDLRRFLPMAPGVIVFQSGAGGGFMDAYVLPTASAGSREGLYFMISPGILNPYASVARLSLGFEPPAEAPPRIVSFGDL